MRKSVLVVSLMLAACGHGKDEARQLAEKRDQEAMDAYRNCEADQKTAASQNADKVAELQKDIKLALDEVDRPITGANYVGTLNWAIEVAALDAGGWRWSEKTAISTSRSDGAVASARQNVTLSVNPADLASRVDVTTDHDRPAIRFYCAKDGCIRVLGDTETGSAAGTSAGLGVNPGQTDPLAGPDNAQMKTIDSKANRATWILGTEAKASTLAPILADLIQRLRFKPAECPMPASMAPGSGASGAPN